ncbi:MAG: tRNA pseudouridine(13) synthase TruD [Candidatus Altiarchaeales archaeon]|nr:MAG: tRNA pseudouridine(13) synthase TruD [Candidatus Altiarchaeales archaeon]
MDEIKPPELEQELGMEVYASRTEGIGGRIKQIPEDFIVEEITPDGKILEIGNRGIENKNQEEKEYVHFTLQKYNWDTMKAIKEISRRLGISHKRFGFAGTKDKRALTTQRVSLWNKKIEDLERVRIKDIKLKDFRYEDERINLGDLLGNRFTVVIRNLEYDEEIIRERISSLMNELKGQIPSFFGVQRFGTVRPITHLVGKEILKKNFKGAVMIYLSMEFEGEDEEVKEVRKTLRETGDFRETLKNFPKHLGYENAMLNFLVKERKKENFIGALRKLPKKLRQMFIHAYQAYIFNKSLSEYIKRGIVVERLPLVGYKTEIDEITSRILNEEGISQEDFRVDSMPELSSKGEYRNCFAIVENLEIINIRDDELNEGKKRLTIRFSLGKGNYATVFLREVMKSP